MAKLTEFIDTDALFKEVDSAVEKFGFERGLSVALQSCNRHLRAAWRKYVDSEKMRPRVRHTKEVSKKQKEQE